MISGFIGLLFGLVVLAIVIGVFVFWIWMLVDCIQNNRLESTQRLIWVLVIFFLHALGALLYFLIGRKGSA